YDAFGVDNVQGPFAHAFLLPVGAVPARHFALGLEVGEQGELQLAIVLESQVAPGAVDGNAEHFGVVLLDQGHGGAVHRQLVAAYGTPVGGIEDENDVAP